MVKLLNHDEKKSVMVTNFGVFKDKCTMQTAILRVEFA